MKRNRASAFEWHPFSRKQKQLLTWWMPKSPYRDYDIVISDGAIRSGKTVAGIDSFITWSLHTFRGQNFIISGKSIGALKRNVLRPTFQMMAAKGIPYRYNRSEGYIEIGSNTYYTFGANNEASQDVLQGLTAAGAYADEVALFPRSFVEQMIGRCSVEGSKIFMNCNPAGPYHYIKTDYIDMADEKRILRLHFTLDDNLTLSEEIKERYRRMFTGVFYQRNILGMWVMAEGVIYDMFDREKHVVPTRPRPYTQYYVSMDYGTQNPTTFGLWGLFNGVWYKVKEYHYDGRAEARQKTDEEYYEDLVEFVGNLPIRSLIIDPSAASFITLVRKKGRFHVRKAKNDVLEGIRNVATALATGRIKYNDCCKETFREFASYVWDQKAQEKRGEDVPLKQNDHHMDGDRYFVNTVVMRDSAISFD
mgnify:FL=1|jgi:phage terminase, large subunit, PBSX family